MCQSLFLHLRRALLVPHSAVVLFWISLLLTMTIHAPFVNAKPRVEDVVAEFINPNFFHGKYPFEKMVIDPSTGRVYVGGVNNLYDIYSDTASLIVKAHAITGPEEDSKECPSRVPCMSAVRKTLHDSYTKGLAVYERNSKLIECSSLFQGRCRWRNLYNIDQREVIKESQQHIVANDNSSSTVIFVGTGTSADGTPSDVLYVASTYVPSGGPFRDDVPAVASRSLDQNHLFDVSVQGVGTGTEIRMHSGYREKYKIDYIGGFQSGKFAYFATRQSKHEDPEVSWFISKLVRVCTGDSHFWSYTEVPLECRKGEENFNLVTDVYLSKPGFNLASALRISTEEDVLYAVFVKGTGRKKDQLTSESALCVYPISQIEQVFLKNIELCFKGEVSKNLPWFTQSDRCSPTKYSSQEVICGKDVNSYIGGEAPIEVEPLLITKDAQFSAVATNTTRGSTVAFIGTHDGKLLKAVIENETSSFIYRSFDVGGGYPVLQDLELDGTGDHVFVLSPFSLSKIKVRQCGDASDCITCLNQRDPYCGWCILNNACVPEGECTKSIPSTQHDWLTYSSGRCPAIRSVDPDKMQITSAYYLNIELENLPITDGKLTCIFDFGNLSSPLTMFAEQDSDGEMRIRCPTPSLMRLPKIPPGLQSISAKLAISNSADGPPLASTTFTFYDCSSFSSCTSCVNSSFPCDWCIESDRCVAGIITESRCRSEHVINGVVRNVPQHRKGPDFCPHIVSTEPTIYVMSGKSQKISVHVKNAMDLMTDFKCQFKVEHSVHERLASKEGDVILCEIMKFEYFGQGFGNGTEIANFSVMWSSEGEQGGGHVLDNINNIHIVMYKCEMLASNCGMCLVVGSKEFDCGWCSNERKCLPQEKCPAVPNSEWLDR
ncbi:hypothetical protein AB6A40_006982 [Gnathostoma spinigerum]|uniref:Sema domain-containing protein n=1 Tax=Gnathostoma spinigerum TaxID=75299 RepID=A0ABD6EJX0_9BILA